MPSHKHIFISFLTPEPVAIEFTEEWVLNYPAIAAEYMEYMAAELKKWQTLARERF